VSQSLQQPGQQPLQQQPGPQEPEQQQVTPDSVVGKAPNGQVSFGDIFGRLYFYQGFTCIVLSRECGLSKHGSAPGDPEQSLGSVQQTRLLAAISSGQEVQAACGSIHTVWVCTRGAKLCCATC
jgi:hypothetical protein